MEEFQCNDCYTNLVDDKEYFCLTEIQIGNKIPDLVIVSKDYENIIAIEFKIDKWKNALKQALNYQLWAQKSYVAFPEDKIRNVLKNRPLFEELGVGILSINNACSIELKAKDSNYITKSYLTLAKDILKSKIENGVGSECST
jgi:hypothetical protein